MKLKIATSAALLLTAFAGTASADMRSCYENAAYAYVAAEADVDIDTARQIMPLMPQGKQMLTHIRDAARSTGLLRNRGLSRATVVTMARGSMQDTPVLARGVVACINRYY